MITPWHRQARVREVAPFYSHCVRLQMDSDRDHIVHFAEWQSFLSATTKLKPTDISALWDKMANTKTGECQLLVSVQLVGRSQSCIAPCLNMCAIACCILILAGDAQRCIGPAHSRRRTRRQQGRCEVFGAAGRIQTAFADRQQRPRSQRSRAQSACEQRWEKRRGKADGVYCQRTQSRQRDIQTQKGQRQNQEGAGRASGWSRRRLGECRPGRARGLPGSIECGRSNGS